MTARHSPALRCAPLLSSSKISHSADYLYCRTSYNDHDKEVRRQPRSLIHIIALVQYTHTRSHTHMVNYTHTQTRLNKHIVTISRSQEQPRRFPRSTKSRGNSR